MAAKNYVYITAFNDNTKYFNYTTVTGILQHEQENLMSQEIFNLKAGDYIYFMPGCTVPRFKIRDILKSKGASICKRMEDATVIVGGPETLHAYTKRGYYTLVLANYFLEFLQRDFPPSVRTQQLVTTIKEATEEHVLIDRTALNNLKRVTSFDTDPDWFSDISERKRLLDEDYDESEDPENPVKDAWVLTAIEDNSIAVRFLNGELEVIDQEPFLKIININNVTMDKQMFEEVRVMFESSEDANSVLAMEVMANANYEKSFLYLALLLKEFGSKIFQQKERNHVNFKALLNFIGIRNYNGHVTIDMVISAMSKKKLLTKTTLAELMPIVQEEMTQNLDSPNFQNNIVPTDHLKDQLVDDVSQTVEIIEEPKEHLELEYNMISPDFNL
jgi:hypothetical protein